MSRVLEDYLHIFPQKLPGMVMAVAMSTPLNITCPAVGLSTPVRTAKCCFTAAGFAHQPKCFALLNIKAYMVYSFVYAVTLPKNVFVKGKKHQGFLPAKQCCYQR